MAYSTFEQVTLSWRGIVASCNQSRNGGKRTRTREISRTSDFGSRLLSFIPFRRSESLQIPVRPWVQHHETYTRHRHNGTHTGPRWWSRCSKVSERWRRSFVRCFFRPSVGRSVRPSVRPSVGSFGGTGPVIGPKLLAPLDRPKIIHPHVPRAQSQTFLCDILCCRYLYLIHEVKPA